MSFIINMVINAVLVLAVAYILPKVQVRNFGSALLVAFLIGILNPTIGWVIYAVFNVATLGLFWLLGVSIIFRIVANAIVIKLVDGVVGGFRVQGFGTALLMAVIMAVLGTIVERLVGPEEKKLAMEFVQNGLAWLA